MIISPSIYVQNGIVIMKSNNSIVSLLGFTITINFFSSDAFANNMGISDAVKSYTYKDGEPYGLSKVYWINTPDAGFQPYYFFIIRC